MKALYRRLLLIGLIAVVVAVNAIAYARVSGAHLRRCDPTADVVEALRRRGCPGPTAKGPPNASLPGPAYIPHVPGPALNSSAAHALPTAPSPVQTRSGVPGASLVPAGPLTPQRPPIPRAVPAQPPQTQAAPVALASAAPLPGPSGAQHEAPHPEAPLAVPLVAGPAPSPAPSPLNRTLREPLPWLSIGIPTVPRPQDLDYLTGTLQAIVDQVLEHGYGHKVLIYVINNSRDRPHAVFAAAEAQFRGHQFLRFVVNPGHLKDDKKTVAHHLNKRNAQVPTAQVRRQTLDLVHMLDVLAGTAQHVLFYEDDFALCDKPHSALLALQYVIDKATALRPDWISIRCSFGMSGIVLQGRDVPAFREYLREHYNRRPPDHLVVEWYAGETPQAKRYVGPRRPVAFQWNLLLHGGRTSSLRSAKSGAFPGCFRELVFPTVFQVEAFNPQTCTQDNVCVVDCCPPVCRCPVVPEAVPFRDWGDHSDPAAHLRGLERQGERAVSLLPPLPLGTSSPLSLQRYKKNYP